MEIPEVKEGFEGAMDQIVGWFEQTIAEEPVPPEFQPARASSTLAPATEAAVEDAPAEAVAEDEDEDEAEAEASQNVSATSDLPPVLPPL